MVDRSNKDKLLLWVLVYASMCACAACLSCLFVGLFSSAFVFVCTNGCFIFVYLFFILSFLYIVNCDSRHLKEEEIEFDGIAAGARGRQGSGAPER